MQLRCLLTSKLLHGLQLDFLICNGALQELYLVSVLLYFNSELRCSLGGNQILSGDAVGLLESIAKTFMQSLVCSPKRCVFTFN